MKGLTATRQLLGQKRLHRRQRVHTKWVAATLSAIGGLLGWGATTPATLAGDPLRMGIAKTIDGREITAMQKTATIPSSTELRATHRVKAKTVRVGMLRPDAPAEHITLS